MSDNDRVHEMDLPVSLSSGQTIRLGELTGQTLLQVVLKEQAELVRGILEAVLEGYLRGRVPAR
jgi:hypothetical protein